MKQKVTLSQDISRSDESHLIHRYVSRAYHQIIHKTTVLHSDLSAFFMQPFAVIPMSADARVNQMKWADWAQILSTLSKHTAPSL